VKLILFSQYIVLILKDFAEPHLGEDVKFIHLPFFVCETAEYGKRFLLPIELSLMYL